MAHVDLNPEIAPARADEPPLVEALLAAHGLPVEGVAALGSHLLLVRGAAGQILGAVGLEVLGDIGLLRSLVVAGTVRDQGYGGRLVAAVERLAQEAGLRELWLLTTTAAPYFMRLGFTPADRATAPARLRATQEFATLCPASAHLLRKSMAPQAQAGGC
jgi:amino-acid N-acetyltransferase